MIVLWKCGGLCMVSKFYSSASKFENYENRLIYGDFLEA